jgi:hypothetical protein
MDTISQNKNTVTSFIDALFTKGDLGAVDEYLAEDFVDHDPPMGGPANREGMRAAGAMFRAAFPDWHSELDFLVEEGDPVMRTSRRAARSKGRSQAVHREAPRINIWRVRAVIVERRGRLRTSSMRRWPPALTDEPMALGTGGERVLPQGGSVPRLGDEREATLWHSDLGVSSVMSDAIMKRQVTGLIVDVTPA